jgi:hypothetical protein
MKRPDPKMFTAVQGEISVVSVEELSRMVSEQVGARRPFFLVHEIGARPRRWETLLYSVLGLRAPVATRCLHASPYMERYALLYEDGEVEWVTDAGSESRELIEVESVHGRDLIPDHEFIGSEHVLPAFVQFYETRKRPPIVSRKLDGDLRSKK